MKQRGTCSFEVVSFVGSTLALCCLPYLFIWLLSSLDWDQSLESRLTEALKVFVSSYMLQSQVQPISYSLRERKQGEGPMSDIYGDDDDLHEPGGGGKKHSKSRRELPAGAVATLKAWLLSPEHFTHPYPTPQDQIMLMEKTGIDKKQLKNWFTNARRRIWKPMLKKQIEQGKLTATGVPGAPGAVPGIIIPGMPGQPVAASTGGMENPHSIQAMRTHYQQAVGQAAQAQVREDCR